MKKLRLFNLSYNCSVIISILVIFTTGASYYVYNIFLRTNQTPIEGYEVGNTFIDLEIPLIPGNKIKISDFKGNIIILDFMIPWCSPCKEQIKVFQRVSGIEGVSIISVNVNPKSKMSELIDYENEEDITWTYGHFPEAALEYEISVIPVVFIIDQTGVIRYRGFFSSPEVLQQIINQYI
jgi:thiol-disulfide isomerase/thioredoxin